VSVRGVSTVSDARGIIVETIVLFPRRTLTTRDRMNTFGFLQKLPAVAWM